LQDYVNLEIKKKSGLSLNPDIHHSKVPSSDRISSKGGVSNYGFHCQRSNGRPEECTCCIKLIIINFQNYSNVHKCLANTPPFLILILIPPHTQLISFLSSGPLRFTFYPLSHFFSRSSPNISSNDSACIRLGLRKMYIQFIYI